MPNSGKADKQANNDGNLSIEQRLAESQLGDSRRQLVSAILNDHEETFYLSSREMAKRYDVDAATIIRSIQDLGYKRYADFTAALRRHFVSGITPYTALEAATREKRTVADHVRYCVEKDVEGANRFLGNIDPAKIVDLARKIRRSRRILVIGVDLAASLSWFLAYGLIPLGFDAEAPVGSTGILRHKIDLLSKKDLLIAISFGRCLRETVEAAIRGRNRGIPTFGITDRVTNAISANCDSSLIASTSSPSFTGSYVAPMALLNAILTATAHLEPKSSLARLSKTEEEYRTGNRWYHESQETS
jgi:DNA-binding MurR/RpiR family transcriptional regulator